MKKRVSFFFFFKRSNSNRPKRKTKTHQHALDARAVDSRGAQVREHDVVVGAARDERVAALLEACSKVFFFGFVFFEVEKE